MTNSQTGKSKSRGMFAFCNPSALLFIIIWHTGAFIAITATPRTAVAVTLFAVFAYQQNRRRYAQGNYTNQNNVGNTHISHATPKRLPTP